jgi:hypothetical protein
MKMHEGPLEIADQFTPRPANLRRQARNVRAVFNTDVRCTACGGRATKKRGDQYLCALDVRVEDQKARRAAMQARR